MSGSPGVRHLFRIGDLEMDGSNPLGSMHCLTCSVQPSAEVEEEVEEYEASDYEYSEDYVQQKPDDIAQDEQITDCEYVHQALFSKNFDYYILDCKGPGLPFTRAFALPTNEPILTMDANDELKDLLNTRAVPRMRSFTVDLPDSNVPAQVRLIMPPGLREEEDFIFPLVLNV